MDLYKFAFTSMGCPSALHIYCESKDKAEDVYDQVFKECDRLDKYYSNYSNDSFISEINRTAGNPDGIKVDPETASLLNYAQECYVQSKGLFDITAGILKRAWNFYADKPSTRPSTRHLRDIQKLVGWNKILWDGERLTLRRKGMEIDFGGVVKEYAADAGASICLKNGITHGYLDMGGDIHFFGPHADGRPWTIGVKNPKDTSQDISYFKIEKGAIASSGDYERFVEIEGKRYSHILNPKTGWPVKGISSASVVASHCIVAGSASTITMLKGKEKGPEWIKAQDLSHVCADSDGNILAI